MKKYYEVGDVNDIVISNSSLSAINPEQGGHPRKFLDFLKEKREYQYSKSLELGRAIHSYIEDPANFVIADFDMPTSSMKQELIKLCYEQGIKDFTLYDRDVYEKLATEAGYKRIPDPDSNDEKYLKYMWDSENKIALDKAGAEKLTNMRRSLNEDEKVYRQLFGTIDGIDKHYKELAIYFTIPTTVRVDNKDIKVNMNAKALIDDLKINTQYAQYIIDDLKSTRKSIFKFPETFKAFRYHRQFGFYDLAVRFALQGAGEVFTREGERIDDFPRFKADQFKIRGYHNVIPVETSDYFLSTVYAVDQYWIKEGISEMQDLFRRIAWHVHEDKWEYSKEQYMNAGILRIGPPEVDYRELREQMKKQ